MVKIRNSSENIVMIIESSYDQLTHVEKSIADYFIKDVQNDDLSSKAVSQRLFVSESSLSRFLRNWDLADIENSYLYINNHYMFKKI